MHWWYNRLCNLNIYNYHYYYYYHYNDYPSVVIDSSKLLYLSLSLVGLLILLSSSLLSSLSLKPISIIVNLHMLVSLSWSAVTHQTASIFYQPNCDTHSGHDIGLPSGMGIWSGETWMIWSSFDEPIDESVCSPGGERNLLLGLGYSRWRMAYFTMFMLLISV